MFLICLTIPNSKMPIEFLEFIEIYLTDVSDIKVLKLEYSKCYGIALKMNSSRLKTFFNYNNSYRIERNETI